MFTLADIHAALSAQLPTRTLTLGPAVFGNDPTLTALLQQYFFATGGALSVTGVTPETYYYDPAKGIIAFTGTGQGGPLDHFAISQVVIKLVEGVPQLSLEAAAPADWTLARSFPALKAPVLRQLPFQQPVLFWASYDSAADDTDLGFYFQGSVDLESGPLSLLNFLLPGLPAPVAWGPITMQGSSTAQVTQYVPAMTLTVDASQNAATVGPFVLHGPELSFQASPTFNLFDKAWQTDSSLKLSTLVQFKSTWIALEADIKDVRTDFQLKAEFNQPIGAALSELATFVGGELAVPGFQLQFPDALLFKSLALGLSPAGAQKVKFIALSVGTAPDEKWPLWSDAVYLEQIDVLFRLFPGAGTTPTRLEGEVAGVVAGWLALQASFSTDGAYRFFGGLARPVSIKELYAFFSGVTLDDLPDLTIDNLDFELGLRRTAGATTATYAGDIELVGEWEMMTEPLALSLKGLLFKLSRDADAITRLQAGAVLDLADYSIGLGGDYQTGDGWTLRGSLALAEQKQDLTAIARRIDATYPASNNAVVAIPTFLQSWQVQQLNADFNTQSKNLNFVAAVKNTDWPQLDIGFGIHLLHQGAAFTKELDGTARYSSDKLALEFDLVIRQETNPTAKPAKKFTIEGTYKASQPPKLSDVLLALAQDLDLPLELPEELNLDAAATGLAVLVEQADADPTGVQLAGTFRLDLAGTALDLHFAYTNATSYDASLQPLALVGSKRAFVFGVLLGGTIDLSKLPLLGKVPGFDQLRLDALGFYYTNGEFATPGQQLYFQAPRLGSGPQLAAGAKATTLTRNGFNLSAVLGRQQGTGPVQPLVGSGALPLPLNAAPTPAPKKPVFAAAAAQPSTPVKWLDVNKTFGPVSLEKVGLNYRGGEATLGLSAGLALGGFTLAVEGLTVSFPMPLPGKPAAGQVHFDIQGLGMDLKTSSFEVGGFFLKDTSAGLTSYYGQVMVQAASFGFKAIGGYSPDAHPASFFLYVNLDVPLGGPPFLFVTGLAGGFGVNTKLKLPTIDELPNCLLLPGKAPAQGSSPGQAVQEVLPALKGLVEPEAGQYWVAAGVRFTSFEMIEAFALVTVAFGVDLQVALLGTCAMTFPKPSPYPIAYVEIDILASFTPSAGLLAIEGRLSPASFIYGGFVHLAGGFAFYLWFAGPHQGDFVVSLGGYAPNFTRPAHYPAVPRLSMAFGLGPFQVLGQAYFALTPGMLMAGLRMQATWTSGPIRVWFDAGVDFLLAWAPLHYEGRAYVSFGVAADIGLLTLHFQIGAELSVWGPQFGGRASIDLDVVSCTIYFGADPAPAVPLGWQSFQEKFLPPPTAPKAPPAAAAAPAPAASAAARPALRATRSAARASATPAAPTPAAAEAPKAPVSNVVKADAARGLLQKDVPGYDWVLDPDGFAIVTNTVIPANYADWNGAALPQTAGGYQQATPGGPYLLLPDAQAQTSPAPAPDASVWNPALHIGPMDRADVKSHHRVALHRRLAADGAATFSEAVAGVAVQPVLLNATAALWGKNNPGRQANDASLLADTLAGLRITPIRRQPARVSDVPLKQLLFQSGHETSFSAAPVVPAAGYTLSVAPAHADAPDDLRITLGGPHAASLLNTNYLLGALADDWVAEQRGAVLADLQRWGFPTLAPSQVAVARMAREKALVDWPAVELLG